MSDNSIHCYIYYLILLIISEKKTERNSLEPETSISDAFCMSGLTLWQWDQHLKFPMLSAIHHNRLSSESICEYSRYCAKIKHAMKIWITNLYPNPDCHPFQTTGTV